MGKDTLFVGLDVHAATIAVAVAEEGRQGEVRSLGRIANEEGAVRKLIKKLGPAKRLRACYEAGPCGYVLYWMLSALGVTCDVVAPTLIPIKVGERVKTDRRDAEKLARCLRAGELTAVWVPDAQHEALRDLVRCREAAKYDQTRARHRLGKFLLRQGRRPPRAMRAWGSGYMKWVRDLRFENYAHEATMVDYLHEVDHAAERIKRLDAAIDQAVEKMPLQTRAVADALQALRGVAKKTAVTVVAELGRVTRFESPCQLMSYAGIVPREHSSGDPGRGRRGAITKTGNGHLRRVLVEAAWAYRHRPSVRGELKRRQQGLSTEVTDIAWRAQQRLHERYRRLSARLVRQKAVTAVARELLAFVWAVAVQAEREQQGQRAGLAA